MKKFLAILLAAMLVLSMTAVAMAEGESGYSDQSTVTIKKIYKLTNAGTSSPAESFSLQDIGTGGVIDGDASECPEITIAAASYDAGAATVNGAEAYFTITLPEYDRVGVYEYILFEEDNGTAGVTYFSNQIKLVVTVIEQEGKVRVAAVHTEDEGGTKSSEIVNTYSAGSLDISKKVTGNLGDKSKYFKVTVTLTGEEDKTYADSYSVSGGSNEDNPNSIAIGVPTDFYLKDAETITIANLPYGVTYTVVEADYTVDDGYDEASYNFSDENMKIDSASDTVTITNNKETDVDTGITTDSLPYIMLMGIVVLCGAAMVMKRRMANND